jgi:hypothetical protein
MRFLPREQILRALYKDSEGMAYLYRDDNGETRGYVMGRAGRIRPFVGPFIADEDNIAAHLLTAISDSYYKKGEKTVFIDTPEDKFTAPSKHRLIKSIKTVRDFTRMYQVVNEESAARLLEEFIKHENLPRDNPWVVSFEKMIYQAVKNYTQTYSFMIFEKDVLQKRIYGTTGPEKG